MIRTETLIVTMNQKDHSLLDKMNIQTDAIVGNQCEYNKVEHFTHNGKNVMWLSFYEKGVGLNRNNILMRSTADFCIFADDDMIFKDGYEKTVTDLFEKYPKVDVLIFNLDEKVPCRFKNTKFTKITKSNYGKYGAARIAVRRERIHLKGLCFNLLFGGGAKYSSGEDSIFLFDCLNKGLNLLAVPLSIAELTDDRDSSWFTGYNDKFFIDKGVVYYLLYKNKSRFIALCNCFKHRNGRYKDYGWRNAYKKMVDGINSVKD